MIRGHGEVVALDRRCHLAVVLEGERRPAMAQQSRLGRRRFDHRAVRREVAAQDRGPALAVDRLVQRTDHAFVPHFRSGDVFAERLSSHGQASEIEQRREPALQRGQAAGIEEILHQEPA